METKARITVKVQGVEIDEEGEGIGAIDQTEVPTSEQDTSLIQRIPQHLPYHHLRVWMVVAALVVA